MMKDKSKVFTAVLLCLLFMVLAGCWDRREIEDMGMVVGLAIDKGKEKNEIVLTNQFVNTLEGKKEEPGVNKYYNITSTGGAIMETVKKVSTLTDNSPYYTHLKVIVISEDIASSENLMDILNWFLRYHELRRTIQIVIAKGEAKKLLEAKLEKKTIPAIEIWGMSQNIRETKKMPRALTVGEMGIKLTDETSFLVQRVEPLQKGIKMSGAAVVSGKQRKLIGWLNEEEMMGANFLIQKRRGKEGGVIKVIDEKTKKPIVYNNRKVQRKIEVKKKQGEISFQAKIRSEGVLLEDWTPTENAFEADYIKKAEKMVADEVKKKAEKALRKLQKELKADVFGFGTQLRIDHYPTWKKYKKNWDEEFSKIPIEVHADIKILEFGGKGTK
jgi:spore germination protein